VPGGSAGEAAARALTAIAVLVLRDFVCTMHRRLFGLDEETVLKSIQMYLAAHATSRRNEARFSCGPVDLFESNISTQRS